MNEDMNPKLRAFLEQSDEDQTAHWARLRENTERDRLDDDVLTAPQMQPRSMPAPKPIPATVLEGRKFASLEEIPASEYVARLTDHEVARDGKTLCPFHEERTPSMFAYDDPDRGFYCYGCGKGGKIVNFGGFLYGIEPYGRGFHEIRERLAQDLGVTA